MNYKKLDKASGLPVGECAKCGGIVRKIKKRGSDYVREIETCQKCGKEFLNRIERQYG